MTGAKPTNTFKATTKVSLDERFTKLMHSRPPIVIEARIPTHSTRPEGVEFQEEQDPLCYHAWDIEEQRYRPTQRANIETIWLAQQKVKQEEVSSEMCFKVSEITTEERKPVDKTSLDAQIDSYMSKTKSSMDAELDVLIPK
uniref:uncharacterized protein LOC120325408 n=1 Tax=Styela clava TaxID=7725 RepID=UPI001939904A|nr:uncharacterized protein LOC120325408 [Styela clava]